MAIKISHAFVSPKSDGTDITLVQPSSWNADLSTSMATGKVLGRTTAGAGEFEELSITGSGSVVFSASPTFTGTASFGSVAVSATTASTSTTTGALTCAGGIGAAGNVYGVSFCTGGSLGTASVNAASTNTSVVAGGNATICPNSSALLFIRENVATGSWCLVTANAGGYTIIAQSGGYVANSTSTSGGTYNLGFSSGYKIYNGTAGTLSFSAVVLQPI